MNINIHTKYLKYKNKYLELKKKMNGGKFDTIDDYLENKEPMYKLENGYIINTFMVNTTKKNSLNIDLTDYPEIKCIYQTDYSDIVFIPKIQGIGILRSDKDMVQSLLLSTHRREPRLPIEMERHIADFLGNPVAKKTFVPSFYNFTEGRFVKNDYMYKLKYKLKLPEIISQTKMKKLVDENYIDVAYAYDPFKPETYYIFSDEEFINNKESFIKLFKINEPSETSEPLEPSEIEARTKERFDTIKMELLTMAFDLTCEKQHEFKKTHEDFLRNPFGIIEQPMYGDDNEYD